MSNCNFIIKQEQAVEQLIEKAKNAILNAKGAFEGNTEKGEFTIPTPVGKIEGKYMVQSDSIAFEITDKPMILSCSRIEDELKKYLGVEEKKS